MILKLGIKERLTITQLFPREENLISQIMVRDISEKTDFTQEEVKKAEIIIENGSYKWEKKKDIQKEIEFTGAEMEFLKSMINKFSIFIV